MKHWICLLIFIMGHGWLGTRGLEAAPKPVFGNNNIPGREVGESLTLESCQALACDNYPLVKQYGLIGQSTEYSVANAAKAYLPQVTLAAQATYQNDVTAFPKEMTRLYEQIGLDFKGLNKDQYKVALEVNQTIWDGGFTRSQKELSDAEGHVSSQSVETEMYTLRDRVNQLYFGILILEAQLQQNTLHQELLQSNRNAIETCVKNGVAMQSDLYTVKAEQLSVSQQRVRIESAAHAYRQMLSVMIGKRIEPSVTLEKPIVQLENNPAIRLGDNPTIRPGNKPVTYPKDEPETQPGNNSAIRLGDNPVLSTDEMLVTTSREEAQGGQSERTVFPELTRSGVWWSDETNNRPELRLFEARTAHFEAQKRAVNASTMPRFGLFAQGFYGNPGLNLFQDMTEDKWTWNYIVGMRLQWNFGSFYTKKGNLRKLSLAQQQVDNQREIFLFNSRLQQVQQQYTIDQMRKVMHDDEEIIRLRTSVRQVSEAKYVNGTLTVNDLLRDITAENQALLNKSLHELEWLKSLYELRNTLNN